MRLRDALAAFWRKVTGRPVKGPTVPYNTGAYPPRTAEPVAQVVTPPVPPAPGAIAAVSGTGTAAVGGIAAYGSAGTIYPQLDALAGLTSVYGINAMSTTPPAASADAYGWQAYNSENATNNSTNIAAGYTAANGYPMNGCTIKSVGGKLRVNFPAGSLGDYDPSRSLAGTGLNAGGNKSKLAIGCKLKLSSNWTNNGNRTTKLVFLHRVPDGDSGHEVNLSAGQLSNGNPIPGVAGIFPQLSLQAGGLGPGNSSNYVMSQGESDYPRGIEHKVEMYFVLNTPGVSNGICKIWVTHGTTGVTTLVLNETTVPYNAAGTTPAWSYLWLDPTYGGGNNNVPADQYFEIDDWDVRVGT